MHSTGLIHRDVKPANMMVGPSGHLTLCDFGLAKWRGGKRAGMLSSSHGQLFRGTPAYMAPEQMRTGPIDQRAGFFAAAILLFELFYGRNPFAAANPALVFHQICVMPVHIPACQAVADDCSFWHKALAKNPADRFANAAAMANAMKSALSTGPLEMGQARALC